MNDILLALLPFAMLIAFGVIVSRRSRAKKKKKVEDENGRS
ncbi:MAG: hypothetical protein ACC619_05385 [Paracoccaceae bacterium]